MPYEALVGIGNRASGNELQLTLGTNHAGVIALKTPNFTSSKVCVIAEEDPVGCLITYEHALNEPIPATQIFWGDVTCGS